MLVSRKWLILSQPSGNQPANSQLITPDMCPSDITVLWNRRSPRAHLMSQSVVSIRRTVHTISLKVRWRSENSEQDKHY